MESRSDYKLTVVDLSQIDISWDETLRRRKRALRNRSCSTENEPSERRVRFVKTVAWGERELFRIGPVAELGRRGGASLPRPAAGPQTRRQAEMPAIPHHPHLIPVRPRSAAR